ncbi:MAG TPA: glycosyltransferase [Herpetosiphonaceae bacterium]
MMSRFPTISETFILYEILELERLGLHVEVFPLIQEHDHVQHPEARAVIERVHYSPFLSVDVLRAQWHWLRRRPAAYLRAWKAALRGNLGSWSFLLRALVVVPQAALFARQMQDLGVEHIHAHWATHPALAAYVIRRLTGIPYSITAHAHDIYEEQAMLEEKLRQASFVVTISDYNRRFLQELYGPEIADKIAVIRCGVDPAVFQPAPAKPDQRPFTIICVASLRDYKGHPYLIEACAQLKAQGIQFRCLLVGEGQDRPQIAAQIARLGLSDWITLLGHQPRQRVSKLVADADVMVLPSVTTRTGKKEGIPVALMEALATEKPVIATAISGIPELIEDGRTGLLVPERDTPSLAQAIRRLYDDPELRRQLGAAGRAKVLQEFNLQQNTAALFKLLSRPWKADTASVSHRALSDMPQPKP